MRVRPDGVELLQAAQSAIEAKIAPQFPIDRRNVLRSIEEAIAYAKARLTRDEVASASELSALEDARAAMRGDVFEALPAERRYDARLIAKAIAIATRQLANGMVLERREYERLCELLGAPAIANVRPPEVRSALPSLNERLCGRIRAGQTDVGTASYAATLEHLEATTHEALSESSRPFYRVAPHHDAEATRWP